MHMDNSINNLEKNEDYYLREVEYFERCMETIQLVYGMLKVSRDHALSNLKQFAPASEEVEL